MDDFEEFTRAAAPALLRLGLALSGSIDDAEDLAQGTLIKMEKRWSRLDEAGRMSYARRVLVNAHLSHRRRTRPRMHVHSDEQVVETPEESALRHERARQVRDAVRALPGRQRAVVVLTHYEGLSAAEVGSVLNLRSSSVRSALARAHQSLRRALDVDGSSSKEHAHVKPL